MDFVLHFRELGKEHVSVAGGKGAQLGEMTQAGISVPPGFVILTAAFDEFLEENKLDSHILKALAKVDVNDTVGVDAVSKQIRDKLAGGNMPENVKKEIHGAFKELGTEFVAVRSSATAEDGSNASWAGELETYLNITEHGVLEHVKKCWSSLFTPRAIVYRVEKGMSKQKISVAVVVQKMVQSEVSGVAFTANPVTNDLNQMIIEAGFGLGEAIVSGMITPDNYVIDKAEEMLLDVTVNEQEMMIVKKDGRTVHDTVPESRRNLQKLDGKNIMALAKLCKLIEKHYGKPQDIEWAFEKGKIYITQTRPITTLK